MSKRRGGAIPKAMSALGRSKDDNNLMEALKLYEAKSYKKSLKLLDATLKKNASHVDSLALKGLNLFFTGQKKDAESYVQRAIGKIQGTSASPVCCHILGIYMRNAKKYAESTRWFQASLDNGSSNKQIYRDLSTLQSQEHDYKNLLKSRMAYWQDFMGYRSNWTALAIAHELNGQNQEAVNVLTKFEDLAKGKLGEAEAYEHNECLMYKNDVLYKDAGTDQKKLQKVLAHLDEVEPEVFDKYSWLERRASVYMKLGNKKEASKVYRTLIKRNPDDTRYYRLLEVSLGIEANNKLRKAVYERFQRIYPKADPPKFIPLTFVKDKQEFKSKAGAYIVPQLKRGVPATFGNVKPLYRKRPAQIPPIVEEVVLEYLATLDAKETPIPFVWTCYFLAQHYLFVQDFARAQEYIDRAIDHTPTLVELYIVKARVLKHLGLLEDAASTIDDGRELDLQDRFINTKTVKYYLRANTVDEAVDVVSAFTRNDDAINGVKDLHLMEASWFIVEQAEAYYRLYLENRKRLQELSARVLPAEDEEALDQHAREVREAEYQTAKYKGLALKRFLALPKFYRQFEDDQLDFHSYCMRKGTPRAYMEMLAWGKTLFASPMFVRAMEGASKLYFDIHDELVKSEADADAGNAQYQGQGQEQKHVAVKKNNKRAKKEAAALNKRKEEDKELVLAYPDDEDVFGEQLVATKKPLEDFAHEFYQRYTGQVRDGCKNQILEFAYQLRCGKLALCLGALTKFAATHGQKHGMVGALALVLLEHTKRSAAHDEIAKKVATKGLETSFTAIPLDKRDDAEFDWLEFYQTNYDAHDLDALLFLYHAQLALFRSQDDLKQLIMDELSHKEPFVQNTVLQYEL